MSDSSHSHRRGKPTYAFWTIGLNLLTFVLLACSLGFTQKTLGLIPLASTYFIYPAFLSGLMAVMAGKLGSDSRRHRDWKWRQVCSYSMLIGVALLAIVVFFMLSGGFASFALDPLEAP